jgi:hypothetical protein
MYTQQVTKLATYSHVLMVLTIVHHAYGAAIYNTPWRLHVLFISIPVLLLTFLLHKTIRRTHGNRQVLVRWLFVFITLIPSMGMIGVFEGLYNHLLKNILFFGGAGGITLQQMFPAPTYEMPNDLIFEVTGILQGLLVIPMLIHAGKLFDSWRKNSPTS